MTTSTSIRVAGLWLCLLTGCGHLDTRAGYRVIECDQPLPAGHDPEHVQCGELTVPENWQKQSGRTLRLRTVVLKSTARDPEPDPFLYLSGGPGSSALDARGAGLQVFTAEIAAPIQAKRDLVFFDLRGTGRSQPALDCPEIGDVFRGLLSEVLPAELDRARLADATVRCFDQLAADGADISGYTSAQMARDVDALREQLGYETWNIWGVSYGSRLLQTLLRDRPEHVRSAVLDSVTPVRGDAFIDEGLAQQKAFAELSAACAASEACSRLTPDLHASFVALVSRLDASPIETHPLDPDSGERVTVFITGTRFALILQQAMYFTEQLPLLPALIVASAGPDAAALLEPLIDPRGLSQMAEGVFFGVRCQESYPFLTREDIERGRRELEPAFRGYQDTVGIELVDTVCRRLQLSAAGSIEGLDVRSDVPSLFLAGELDPIIRPATTRSVAELFSRSHYFEFPGFGHGILRARSAEPLPRCAMRMVAAFLDDPLAAPDASCLGELPALAF